MQTGVYQILNKVNNKKYIGSTSVSFSKRWSSHICDLIRNRHRSDILQKAYNKYGKENFEFKILQFCPPELCIEKEQWFIDWVNPEYNICKIANSTLGYKHTECSKDKISNSLKGRKISELGKKNMSISRQGVKKSENIKNKMSNSKLSFLYDILCPNGDIIQINNLNKFVKQNKLNNSCLFYTFEGVDSEGFKRNHHKGYKIINKTRL